MYACICVCVRKVYFEIFMYIKEIKNCFDRTKCHRHHRSHERHFVL